MIISIVTIDGAVKYAASNHDRAEQYAQNMRTLYPDAEVTTWAMPLDEQRS